MELQDLKCRNCGAGLDQAGAALRCQHCGSLFAVESVAGAEGPKATVKRPRVALPERIEMRVIGTRLIITRTWRKPLVWAFVLFTACWNGFLLLWLSIAFAKGEWGMSMAGSVPLVVGFGLAYTSAAALYNRTTLQVGRKTLAISHAPIPWPGTRTLPVPDIKQVYCQQFPPPQVQMKDGSMQPTPVPAVLFSVMLQRSDGRKERLVTGLDSADQALFIEQEIEAFLSIEDKAQPDELARPS